MQLAIELRFTYMHMISIVRLIINLYAAEPILSTHIKLDALQHTITHMYTGHLTGIATYKFMHARIVSLNS